MRASKIDNDSSRVFYSCSIFHQHLKRYSPQNLTLGYIEIFLRVRQFQRQYSYKKIQIERNIIQLK